MRIFLDFVAGGGVATAVEGPVGDVPIRDTRAGVRPRRAFPSQHADRPRVVVVIALALRREPEQTRGVVHRGAISRI